MNPENPPTPFSEVETQRLDQYEQLIRTIHDSRDILDNGTPIAFMMSFPKEENKPDELLYTIDQEFVWGMQNTALRMREKLSQKPDLLLALEDIEETFRIECEEEKAYELLALQKMYENGEE